MIFVGRQNQNRLLSESRGAGLITQGIRTCANENARSRSKCGRRLVRAFVGRGLTLSVRKRGPCNRFPHMDDARLARVSELRKQIDEATDRDELYRLRQALKFERDQAAADAERKRSNF